MAELVKVAGIEIKPLKKNEIGAQERVLSENSKIYKSILRYSAEEGGEKAEETEVEVLEVISHVYNGLHEHDKIRSEVLKVASKGRGKNREFYCYITPHTHILKDAELEGLKNYHILRIFIEEGDVKIWLYLHKDQKRRDAREEDHFILIWDIIKRKLEKEGILFTPDKDSSE
ncbi:TPA: hypothetical protein H1008_02485 [archaeon]|nr:hypothetical protein [Candidatus Undinarchaeales archaeon SRR5007147.bin71]